MSKAISIPEEVVIKLNYLSRKVIINGITLNFKNSQKIFKYKVKQFGWGDKKKKKEAYQLAGAIINCIYKSDKIPTSKNRLFANKYLITLPKGYVILNLNKDRLKNVLLKG